MRIRVVMLESFYLIKVIYGINVIEEFNVNIFIFYDYVCFDYFGVIIVLNEVIKWIFV